MLVRFLQQVDLNLMPVQKQVLLHFTKSSLQKLN